MCPIPKDFGEFAEAYWKRVGPILVKNRVLDELDKENFELLCSSYQLMKTAEQAMNEGVTVDDRGSLRKHPGYTIWSKASDQFVRLSRLFGLSPLHRNEKLITPDEVDDDEKFLFGS